MPTACARFVLSCFVPILCVTFVAPTEGSPPYWHRETIDSGAQCGRGCWLALDPNGNPGVAYVDGDGALAFAWREPEDPNNPVGVWHKSVIQPDNHLGHTSLAYAPTGEAYVAYLAQITSDPYYSPRVAYFSGGSWYFTDAVPVQVDMAMVAIIGRLKIAFDGGNRPWLAFTAATPGGIFGLICCAVHSSSGWQVGKVDEVSRLGCAVSRVWLEIAPNGWPAVSYHIKGEESYLRYASYESAGPPEPNTTWTVTTIHEDPQLLIEQAWDPSFAFNSAGTPGFACILDRTDADDAVAFLRGDSFDEIAPTESVVAYPGHDLCFVYRADGSPAVSYHDGRPSAKTLMYAWLDPNDPNDPNGVWLTSQIDGRRVFGDVDKGFYHCMVVDANDMLAIAYIDATMGRLMYAVTADQPDTYTLTTWNEGAGHGGWGTIERDPNQQTYSEGTTVELTAVPAEDRIFVKWAIYDPRHPGDVNYAQEDTNNPTTILMEYDREVGAVFGCSSQEESMLLPVVLVLTCAPLGLAKLRGRHHRA
ncbi:MAG: hypothetical protein JXQ73_28460 [Phycisphaerae bacterium]|nr:hypothetical protein [Phycisphaerae bacterium]